MAALGAILVALTLSGSAWGQTLGVVGSVVDTTTESLQPVTQAVNRTASKAVEPVATTAAEATRPAKTQASAPAKTSSPATRTVAQASEPVASTGSSARAAADRVRAAATPPAQKARKSAAPVVRTATAVLPSETQALLGPLVETIDGQAEELTGSLLSAISGVGGTVSALAGALVPSEGSGQHSSQVWDGGTRFGYGQVEEPAPVVTGTAERTGAPGGMPPVPDRGAALAAPPYPAAPPAVSAATSQGARAAGESGSPGARPAPSPPAAPGSALGSSTGFSAVFAVLAGLFALALAAFLGRLLPWSDTVRPLAFVLPPERPG